MTHLKLAARLKHARQSQRLSTRKVSALSKGGISCGYLSQIEMGHIEEVCPPKLRILSRVYGLDYLELMVLAGYLTVKEARI